jgi:hypothetical protein
MFPRHVACLAVNIPLFPVVPAILPTLITDRAACCVTPTGQHPQRASAVSAPDHQLNSVLPASTLILVLLPVVLPLLLPACPLLFYTPTG